MEGNLMLARAVLLSVIVSCRPASADASANVPDQSKA
jgi:streptogramin lyase